MKESSSPSGRCHGEKAFCRVGRVVYPVLKKDPKGHKRSDGTGQSVGVIVMQVDEPGRWCLLR
jgi:hypothetical protein